MAGVLSATISLLTLFVSSSVDEVGCDKNREKNYHQNCHYWHCYSHTHCATWTCTQFWEGGGGGGGIIIIKGFCKINKEFSLGYKNNY